MAIVQGLRADSGLMAFEFKPSVGLVARDLVTYGMTFKSFREPLERSVREVMIPSIQKNFDAGGRPVMWEPDAEATTLQKSFYGLDTRTMHRSMGTQSLEWSATRLARWQFGRTSAAFTNFPMSKFYGGILQAGADSSAARTSGTLQERIAASITAAQSGQKSRDWHLPARPFVMYQPEDFPKIEAVFDLWLQENMIKRGWRPF